MTNSEKFSDWIILRTIQLQAVSTWILRDVINRLEKLEAEILTALAQSGLDGTQAGREQRANMRDFKDGVDKLITAAFKELASRIEDDFDTLSAVEEKKQREIFALWLAAPGAVNIAIGSNVNILGSSIRDTLGKQAGDLQFRIEQAIQAGLDAGDDASKLRRRVKGWPGTGEQADAIAITPATKQTERALEQTIRTGVQEIADEVQTGLGSALPKTIRIGWQQISVLDSRTTQICRAYAFKTWDKDFNPTGAVKLPFNGGVPRHVNCRSRIVLYMLDDGPTPELTFKQWVDRLEPEKQKQIFGDTRLKMWREGKLSDQDLIRQQWRAISPDELENL